MSNTELIDEMKAHLPIPAYAGRDLCRHLLSKGENITPETELKIIEVIESGEEGGIVCCLDAMLPDAYVISLTLLRIKPDHPLFDKISTYQKRRTRNIFRSKDLRQRRQ